MLQRRPLFPGVIEMNHQAGWRIGCNVYLVYDDREWVLIDVGFTENVEEIVEMIRQMDFPLSACKALIATHADVDHIQGLAKAKALLKAPILAHPLAVESLESGDRIKTFAEIAAQNIHLEMPAVKVDRTITDGEWITVGTRKLQVWHTPGHTDSQLAFRLDDLLLSGDTIYRDGSVGAIDAHHGSDIPAFIASLERIAASDVDWLLPSHGPIFRRDNALLRKTIERVNGYLSLADFGTCAPAWPLMEQWDRELAEGRLPSTAPRRE
ncbi:MAG: MBL fold metallo-hydrolase [Planctomycetota bacterium]|nr:MAG: MBL fold metallo-hydrolase [Planctomycetota bacterium]